MVQTQTQNEFKGKVAVFKILCSVILTTKRNTLQNMSQQNLRLNCKLVTILTFCVFRKLSKNLRANGMDTLKILRMISETIKAFYTKGKKYSRALRRGPQMFISWTNQNCNAEEIDVMPGEKYTT